MDEILKIINANSSEIRISGNKPTEWIIKAESMLECKFPTSYKLFLEKWGVLRFDGNEYYGIVKDDFENSGIPDVVWFNMRRRFQDNFPKHLIIFKDNLDSSEYLCIDVSKIDDNGECPVVVWNNINKEIEQTLDANFGDILLEDLEESFG